MNIVINMIKSMD